ncbi:hypothetical protein OG730_04605 [Streptomyces sp. NBC_01298]|uniref:hypothetical protein n=1 Tax=Streptomyces sp. NBC_01298 TaxID=2903817 RepID=UPI002E14FE5C|nr:hypothetical protein OG730_04605 [Streptomyces sp. NBC_01298]
MIDVQRIIALSQQPRPGGADGPLGNASDALRLLGHLDYEDDLLAMPIAWSEAACRDAGRRAGAGRAAKALCSACPLHVQCASALMAGAPPEVRQWRERVDGGRALAA